MPAVLERADGRRAGDAVLEMGPHQGAREECVSPPCLPFTRRLATPSLSPTPVAQRGSGRAPAGNGRYRTPAPPPRLSPRAARRAPLLTPLPTSSGRWLVGPSASPWAAFMTELSLRTARRWTRAAACTSSTPERGARSRTTSSVATISRAGPTSRMGWDRRFPTARARARAQSYGSTRPSVLCSCPGPARPPCRPPPRRRSPQLRPRPRRRLGAPSRSRQPRSSPTTTARSGRWCDQNLLALPLVARLADFWSANVR